MWQGNLLEIHTAQEAGADMKSYNSANLIVDQGIEGDRYATGKGLYSPFPDVRDVTLIEIETIEALKRDFDIELPTIKHRRNLTTRNVPLNHLVGKQFWVGETLLEGGRLNTPCRYLDKLVNLEVCVLMEHRSGLNCRIISGGVIKLQDVIRPYSISEEN